MLLTILLIFQDAIIAFYTTNEAITELAKSTLMIFCIAVIPDCVLYAHGGALRGLNR